MMTLDEAIQHCKDVILQCQDNQKKCAIDHIQLMQWLVELKTLRKVFDQDSSNGISNDLNNTLEETPVESWNKFLDEEKYQSKFKVGDWVVQENIGTYKIIEVCESWYEVIDNQNNHYSIGFDQEYMCHLWSIKDAKDGDILAVENIIFIYKRVSVNHIVSYCKLINDIFEPFEDGGLNLLEANILPATKEQCEILFSKMHVAGYEWDDNKKELKKISQEFPTTSDECIKSAWDEGDEICLSWVIKYFNPSGELYSNLIYWFKSLKDRIQSKSRWNPSDEDKLRIKQAIMYLSKKLRFESEKDDYSFREGQIKWLKSLQDRVQ